MGSRPQTIQIFLPSGDPQGIRVAEITTRIIRVIEVPRSLLTEFLKMPEAGQVGVYMLVSAVEDGSEPSVYIGQSGNVGVRLVQHNQTKDFWNKALIVVSLTNNLTQTHALFLEWFAIRAAQDAGRYAMENGNAGARPYTPAPLEADCHEIFDTARTLLATLGHPVAEPVAGTKGLSIEKEIFYCKGPEADAKGEYTTEGFVVLKGSKARIKNVDSIIGTSDERFREKLVKTGILIEQNGTYLFSKDHLFTSPSMAAVAVLGRSANGWNEWKDKNGKTLNSAKRMVA